VPDHYATLGLDRDCTDAHIRDAYRLLAKQLHPDVNQSSAQASAHTQALNAAYEILGNAARRSAYDQQLAAEKKFKSRSNNGNNLAQDVYLRLEDFLRGTTLEIRVKDPGNAGKIESYPLIIPPATAPGTRFRIARTEDGFLIARVKAMPDFRFKIRGSDLRCDLNISHQRATQGGVESVRGLTGNFLHVQIPRNVVRGEILRISGEGLPKLRGGRGDLLVRIIYRPEIHITRPKRS